MIERATAIYDSVREHKRAEQHHRRRARQQMAELMAFCERVGLDFEVVKGRTKSNGQGPRERQDTGTY